MLNIIKSDGRWGGAETKQTKIGRPTTWPSCLRRQPTSSHPKRNLPCSVTVHDTIACPLTRKHSVQTSKKSVKPSKNPVKPSKTRLNTARPRRKKGKTKKKPDRTLIKPDKTK